MKKTLFLISSKKRWIKTLAWFFAIGMSQHLQAATCTTSCSAYGTAYYCSATCNYCSSTTYNELPRPVNTLPLEFTYNRADPNTANDTCSSSHCGTLHCTGSTSYSTNVLPAPAGACQLTPDNKTIPGVFRCQYKDFFCNNYCSNWVPYTICVAYSTVCS